MIREFGPSGFGGLRNPKVSHRPSPKIVANDHKSKRWFGFAVVCFAYRPHQNFFPS